MTVQPFFSSASSYGSPGRQMSMNSRGPGIANPYHDWATGSVPKTFADVIDWSEHVGTLSDDLGRGIAQLYAYFSTDLNIYDMNSEVALYDQQNISKWKLLINQKLSYHTVEQTLGRDVGIYGNSFITATLLHTRTVQCPTCGWMTPVNVLREMSGTDFEFRDMKFILRCQGRCKRQNNNRKREFIVKHSYTRSVDNIVIKHWPIRELDFDYLEARNKLRIYWRIPQRIRKLVLHDMDVDLLHDLDWSVLEAICKDKLMEFDERVMFHAKEPHLSGLNNRGLGIPRTLQLARQHWLVQLLKKQYQALAGSYVLPMRFFSLAQPQPGAMNSDPLSGMMLSQFADHMESMVEQHRRNPHKHFAVPYPVQYNVAGANANQFAPVALMEQASADLANSLVPQAMLRGDMTIQAAPMFIRLFESVNREIPQMYNSFCWWFAERISELLQLEPVQVQHIPVSIADNMAIDSLLQGAASMGKASDDAWMPRLGLDPRVERSRQLTDQLQDLQMQRAMQKVQEDYGFTDQLRQQTMAGQGGGDPNAQAQGGDPSQGGQPPVGPTGPGMVLPSQGFKPSTDINQMGAEAEAQAQAILALPGPQRRMELAAAKQISTEFHAMVVSAMERQRRDIGSQAVQQMVPA